MRFTLAAAVHQHDMLYILNMRNYGIKKMHILTVAVQHKERSLELGFLNASDFVMNDLIVNNKLRHKLSSAYSITQSCPNVNMTRNEKGPPQKRQP